MNRESRPSGVAGFLPSGIAAFLRPDKLALLFIDEDKDPDLSPLVTVGDRADEDETFETDFLTPLLALLSNEEVVFLEDEDETDNAGLAEGFLTVSCLLTRDPDGLFRLRSNGDPGDNFTACETLVDFVTTEGKELLLSSGSDRLIGSADLLPTIGVALLCCLVVETDGF